MIMVCVYQTTLHNSPLPQSQVTTAQTSVCRGNDDELIHHHLERHFVTAVSQQKVHYFKL